jgi:ACR3 family arsenite efflux pump ArsB
MFALAWLLVLDLPEYRTGSIIVGLARDIAMVIIWNGLACGDREAAAVLVALNSLFQVAMFAVLDWFLPLGPAGMAGLGDCRDQRLAVPLLAYFALMWGGGYLLGAALGLGYARTTTLAFTAAGNNFELAIAVAIVTYGPTSGQALAGVVGPLIEVPVLVALVYVSLLLRKRFRSSLTEEPQGSTSTHD